MELMKLKPSQIPKPSMAVSLGLFCRKSGSRGGSWGLDRNLHPSRADDLMD